MSEHFEIKNNTKKSRAVVNNDVGSSRTAQAVHKSESHTARIVNEDNTHSKIDTSGSSRAAQPVNKTEFHAAQENNTHSGPDFSNKVNVSDSSHITQAVNKPGLNPAQPVDVGNKYASQIINNSISGSSSSGAKRLNVLSPNGHQNVEAKTVRGKKVVIENPALNGIDMKQVDKKTFVDSNGQKYVIREFNPKKSSGNNLLTSNGKAYVFERKGNVSNLGLAAMEAGSQSLKKISTSVVDKGVSAGSESQNSGNFTGLQPQGIPSAASLIGDYQKKKASTDFTEAQKRTMLTKKINTRKAAIIKDNTGKAKLKKASRARLVGGKNTVKNGVKIVRLSPTPKATLNPASSIVKKGKIKKVLPLKARIIATLVENLPLIIALVVALVGGTAVLFGKPLNTVLHVPAVGQYLMNGEEPTDAQWKLLQEEIDKQIYYSDSIDENSKDILVSQRAVDKMDKIYIDKCDSIKTDVESYENMKSSSVVVDDATVPNVEITGLENVYKYTHDTIFVGSDGTNNDTEDEIRPEDPFSDLPTLEAINYAKNESKEKAVKLVYHSGSSTATDSWYPASSYTQYLGISKKIDLLETPSYMKIVGWSLTESGSVPDVQPDFTKYQEIDDAVGQRIKESTDSDTRTVNLYAVYGSNGSSIKYLPVSVVTEDEINGDLSDYFNEDSLSIQFAYVDENGETVFSSILDENSDEKIYRAYDEKSLIKAILGMATIVTENDDYIYSNSEENSKSTINKKAQCYVDYCAKIMGQAMDSISTFRVEFDTVRLTGTKGTKYGVSWTDDSTGRTYQADGARLTCKITVYIDISADSLMDGDDTTVLKFSDFPTYDNLTQIDDGSYHFVGWTKANRDWLYEYLEYDDEMFIGMYNIVFPSTENRLDSDDPVANTAYSVLVKNGYSKQAACAIISNLVYEYGEGDIEPDAPMLDMDYESSERWNNNQFSNPYYMGFVKAPYNSLSEFASQYGQQWEMYSGGIDAVVQTMWLIKQLEDPESGYFITAPNDSRSRQYADNFNSVHYAFMQIDDFKKLDDIQHATICFAASYVGSDDYTPFECPISATENNTDGSKKSTIKEGEPLPEGYFQEPVAGQTMTLSSMNTHSEEWDAVPVYSLDQLQNIAKNKYGLNDDSWTILVGWIAGDTYPDNMYYSYLSCCAAFNIYTSSGGDSAYKTYMTNPAWSGWTDADMENYNYYMSPNANYEKAKKLAIEYYERWENYTGRYERIKNSYWEKYLKYKQIVDEFDSWRNYYMTNPHYYSFESYSQRAANGLDDWQLKCLYLAIVYPDTNVEEVDGMVIENGQNGRSIYHTDCYYYYWSEYQKTYGGENCGYYAAFSYTPGVRPPEMENELNKLVRLSKSFYSYIRNTTSGEVEEYISVALEIASDNSHGYGNPEFANSSNSVMYNPNKTCLSNQGDPDFDCGSFVYYCLMKGSLIEETGGLNEAHALFGYIGSEKVSPPEGWVVFDYTGVDNLQRGDLVIRSLPDDNYGHISIYLGNNEFVDASGDNDNKTGDSGDNEIYVHDDDPSGWNANLVARYVAGSAAETMPYTQQRYYRFFTSEDVGNMINPLSETNPEYGSTFVSGYAVTTDPSLPVGTIIKIKQSGDYGAAVNFSGAADADEEYGYFLIVSNGVNTTNIESKNPVDGTDVCTPEKIGDDYIVYLYTNTSGNNATLEKNSLYMTPDLIDTLFYKVKTDEEIKSLNQFEKFMMNFKR